MRGRSVLFIITALLCQLLPAAFVVTNGLLARAQAGTSAKSNAKPAEPVTIHARQQEKNGDLYTLRGDAEVDYRNWVFRSDLATYNAATGDVTATGHFTMDGGAHDEHIQASHGQYNLQTEKGKFYDVVGTTGLRLRGKRVTLTSSSPFAFSGRMVEKLGPDRYVIHHGTVTSCELPRPKWTFSARRVVVDIGETAKIYDSFFRIKRVPIFYFPFTRHPVEKLPRQSGFLMPTFGTSSRKGTILGDSFYWAINRSMDATLGAELWTARGWAQHGDFRYQPSDNSYFFARYFGVVATTKSTNVFDQSGRDIQLFGGAYLPHQIRAVGTVDYLSSYVFRLSFAETFTQAINSEVKSAGFLSKNYNGYSFNLLAARYQNFQSTTPNDAVTILHVPSLEASSVDRSVRDTRFFWSFDAAAEGLSRSEPDFHTSAVVGRFDVHPSISYSWIENGWSLRPEVAVRDTYYTHRRLPTGGIGTTITDPVNRRALETSLELRPPAMARIFSRPFLGQRIKHSIEPRVVYRYVRGVENFANIIRFDYRDILSNTNEVEVGLVNRIYGKPLPLKCRHPEIHPQSAAHGPVGGITNGVANSVANGVASTDCSSIGATPRELFTWQIGAKYFLDRSFGGALVPGQRNVLTTTADFTGITFLTEPRRFSPIISRMRVQPSAQSNVEWSVDYDAKKGQLSSSSTFFDYRIRDMFFSAGHTFLRTPGEIFASTAVPALPAPSVFNQFRLLAGYGNPNKRGLTAASSVGFDAKVGFAQYVAAQTTYNWDCCGITAEFRRLALGPVRNENQFRFAFTVSNIGTFGTLKRQERIY
jgi:LPS-assembly protein